MEIGRLKYGIFKIFSTREDLEKFIEEKDNGSKRIQRTTKNLRKVR